MTCITKEILVSSFIVKPLNESTWPDFARLVEKNNGIWGGCWCMSFHEEGVGRHKGASQNRSEKECRVLQGRAHAALVYKGPDVVGWCQFGSPDELPRIKHKKEYLSGLEHLPDWRITCFFVDKEYRGQGIASIALEGALNEISKLGGGIVESYPEDVEGRSVSSSFLHNATISLFEHHGFKRTRRLGKNHWVVTRRIEGR
jgi:ribosomal protein S18 acetylase RimI-like enzyme